TNIMRSAPASTAIARAHATVNFNVSIRWPSVAPARASENAVLAGAARGVAGAVAGAGETPQPPSGIGRTPRTGVLVGAARDTVIALRFIMVPPERSSVF